MNSTTDAPNRPRGRPRKFAKDNQEVVSFNLTSEALASIDARNRSGRSDALRDVLARYEALVEEALPSMTRWQWMLSLTALQGEMPDFEDWEGETMPICYSPDPQAMRTTIWHTAEGTVSPSDMVKVRKWLSNLTAEQMLAIADVAQRYWAKEGKDPADPLRGILRPEHILD